MTTAEMIGKFVGDYQITELLGEGGMGVVFKGVHPTLGQLVAIKMLQPSLVKADSIKQRFLVEAQAMARLRHENILQLYNFIENPEGCFIVMEYVEGETLEDRLDKQGLIPPEAALDLFIPGLKAMEFAHQNGIIHRDIKPSNIMVLNSGTVKVMDFGTAKMASGPALTAAGMTLGTVVYMSPEQLMGRDLSPQADIYSLGVTLYELTTGKLPFYHDNEMQLMRMIMKEDPPAPSQHYPAMPPALDAAIMRAIAKDRTHRFASAGEFAQELERIRAELTGAGSGSMPAPGSGGSSGAVPVPPVHGATAHHQQAVADVEDTQTVPRTHDGATTMHQAMPGPQAGGPGGVSILVWIGIGGTVLGAILLAVLMAVGQLLAGGIAGGVLLVVGITLLIVGLVTGGGGAQTSMGTGQMPAYGGAPGGGAAPGAAVGAKCLEVLEGPNRGERYDLAEKSITLGRAPDNDVVFKDPSVSSHHARIDFYQGKYYLYDLKSSNGSYINNARIEQAELSPRDVVSLGASRMVVNL